MFGSNVEDPENGHMIGILGCLVGNMKSAYVHEIIFKRQWKMMSIVFLGSTSGVGMSSYTIGTA